MNLPSNVRNWFTIALAGIALLGFAALVGYALAQTWTSETTPSFTDWYLYFATALTGLVGSVVAAGFGQKLPEAAPEAESGRLARNVAGLGSLAKAVPTAKAKAIVASVYAGVYILWGLAAIVTCMFRSSVAPDLVKSLAGVASGLFLAIARSFVTEPEA
jgi:hypothetical protein